MTVRLQLGLVPRDSLGLLFPGLVLCAVLVVDAVYLDMLRPHCTVDGLVVGASLWVAATGSLAVRLVGSLSGHAEVLPRAVEKQPAASSLTSSACCVSTVRIHLGLVPHAGLLLLAAVLVLCAVLVVGARSGLQPQAASPSDSTCGRLLRRLLELVVKCCGNVIQFNWTCSGPPCS